MNRDTFSQIIEKINVSLSEEQLNQLDQYYHILVEWNEFMNLTGITEYDQVLVKHFADSLAVKKAIDDLAGKDSKIKKSLDLNSSIRIMDVGTGAGFPGLPLKIAYPKTQVVLLDSLNKRIKFLNEVITQLGLNSIEAIHGRAEEYARNVDYREQSDLVVSRAVANLATLVEYCLPYTKVGGYFISYKSGDIEEEAIKAEKAVRLLGGEIAHIYKFQLPESDIDRSFVIIRKITKTAKKFPRKAGLPGKEPIE